MATLPRPRYGWVSCVTCGGSGTTSVFKGTAAVMTHLARGGSPTQLPCSACSGDGRVWARIDLM